MKRKGFTLTEVIVVIAIIGVLAAILVPAMLNYVKRSKITSANTAAKQIFNGLNTATVELDGKGVDTKRLDGDYEATGAEIAAQGIHTIPDNPTVAQLQKVLYGSLADYFSDITKVDKINFRMYEDGCKGVGVVRGRYPGSYPIAVTIELYDQYRDGTGDWDAEVALGLAVEDSSLYDPD